jgi:hypothetical protein
MRNSWPSTRTLPVIWLPRRTSTTSLSGSAVVSRGA